MADAGDVFITWRWVGDTAPAGVGVAPDEQVRAVLDTLTSALPDPARPGGLEAALTAGPYATYDSENQLAQELSSVFLPYRLAVTLHELMTRGVRPHIRIQPSPRTAQVPWELLGPDPAIRLIDIADVSVLAPVTVSAAPGRVGRSWAQSAHLPVVAVLDPRVPGFRADSELGSVLGRPDPLSPIAKRVAVHAQSGRLRPDGDPFRSADVDREWLSATLRAGASRLLYVGHVTAAAPESGRSETADLHLTCAATTLGHEPPLRSHRPLSARDLLLGTFGLVDEPVAGQDIWPIPSRVALVACESGGDLRFTESLGLVAAMVWRGAGSVSA